MLLYGTANLNSVSRSKLLYQGSQYVVLSRLLGKPIISEKLVGVLFALRITRSAATIFCVLTIATGPLLIPAKLLRVLAPAAKLNGLPCISWPRMNTRIVACWVLTLAIRSCVSILTLLYQGSQ